MRENVDPNPRSVNKDAELLVAFLAATQHLPRNHCNMASNPAQSHDIPQEMTAIGIPAPGGPEALVPERRAVPQPAANEVLIRVAAAGVNRPDVLQRMGKYQIGRAHV